MRSTRKFGVATAGIIAAMALSLTACSSGGTSSTGGDTATSGADSDTGSEEVELSFSTWLPTQVQWPELIAAFEDENPGISIDFQRDEDYDAFRTNLDNEILAGETPDIFGIQAGASFNDYAEYALPVEEYATDWIEGVREEPRSETTTQDGVEAAVPILTAGMQFYLYNQNLFTELGLDLPTNYEELVKVSQAANSAGYTPFAMGAADAWHDADFFVWLSNQYGSGGDIYKAAGGEIPWDSESLVQAATDWQKLFTDGVFQQGALTTTTYPAARDDYFLAGRALALPTGSWHVGMALVGPDQEQPGSAIEDDEVGMAVFPQIGPNNGGATSGVDFALAISSDIDEAKLDAAAKFVEFMAVGTGQQLWVNTLQGFPVADGIQVEVADDEPEIAKESLSTVEDALAESRFPRKLNVSGWDSLEQDLGIVLQDIAGGADPAATLATLNK
ncbi:ABC transporter substrate-binding protein [Schaalia sp. JY-X159]|uniref:ABC transporter substrate-binding protein n=1 Tax=Schaalia sp. JY-X159 TaxID=2758575 RepID=UPI00165E14D1|nr:ABC transporter substrate-binding protein [Schaalia sp. JY-X159]